MTHEHVFETIASVGRARSYRTAAQRWSGIRMLFKTGQIQPSLSDDRYKTVVEFQSLRQKNTCLMSSRVMRFGNDTYSDSFIQKLLQNYLSSLFIASFDASHTFKNSPQLATIYFQCPLSSEITQIRIYSFKTMELLKL